MPNLKNALSSFIETINNGPSYLNLDLFNGSYDRIILGLKAHANTINHARLVALETTFPLTKQHLGDAEFRLLSHKYIETPYAKSSTNNEIGARFPEVINDVTTRELAEIELAYGISYNAASVPQLLLSELSNINESQLLSIMISPHPAAQIVDISVPLAAEFDYLSEKQPAAVLTVRPDTDVRIFPINYVQKKIFESVTKNNATIGNLLRFAIETPTVTETIEPLVELINAGVFMIDRK